MGLPEEDRNYGRDDSELRAEPSVMLPWQRRGSTVASYIGRETDRQTDRQTDRLIKLYF